MTSEQGLQPKLTPQRLRDHAEADMDAPAWNSNAMQLLLWAADCLEAAELALEAEIAKKATKQ